MPITAHTLTTSIEVVPYIITSTTREAFRETLRSMAPKDRAGQFVGYVSWAIRCDWPGRGASEADLARAEVRCTIRVTLPHWAPAVPVSEELARSWDAYLSQLGKHERVHIDAVLNTALAISRELPRLRHEDTERYILNALNALRVANQQIDDETGHGFGDIGGIELFVAQLPSRIA